MKVKWLGHASFVITAEDGTRIITDPYNVGGGIDYGAIQESADIVTVGHKHADHDNIKAVRGNPQLVSGVGSHRARGIEFKGIATYHDPSGGKERGPNTVFCFTVDGIRLCHLSDLGHRLSEQQAGEIGEVGVLFIPVGGVFTIDATTASLVCDHIKPKVVIPMHYKTAKCAYPISGVEEFLKGKPRVKRVDASEVELEKDELPQATEVIVLKHAL